MQEMTTPMMKQYMAVKKQYQDCLLFFRMGDFYELFLEDAHIGAQVLNITLTGRPKGKDGRIPMAGVPYHAVDVYLAKLVKAGYKVAICEQISEPSKTGIIDREVVRIVTPGTLLDEKALEKKEHNYIVSITVDNKRLGLAIADLSTGSFSVLEKDNSPQFKEAIADELARLHPAECILPPQLYNSPTTLAALTPERQMSIYEYKGWSNDVVDNRHLLFQQFRVKTLAGFGLVDLPLAQEAAANLLAYLQETQKGAVSHITDVKVIASDSYVLLDRSTILNLELFSTLRDHDQKASLLSVLDATNTAMGGRLLREWMRKPLMNKKHLEARLECVDYFHHHRTAIATFQAVLKEIPDIERLLSRLSVGLGNARDLVNLKLALLKIQDLKQLLAATPFSLHTFLEKQISPSLHHLITLIEQVIMNEPPVSIREGGMIKHGVNKELDALHTTIKGSKDWINTFEQKERARSGISSLKVKFNKVFGFYIEISKANLHLAPPDYLRKQTLVNGERFITDELKHHEEIILTAEEKINALELSLFSEVLKKVLAQTKTIQQAANSVAIIDCLVGFAEVAQMNTYVKPTLRNDGTYIIRGGRHPVVEKLLPVSEPFVPNDVSLDKDQELVLLTGPNMAGKSVYMRQVALIVLMTHMGSFVPADSAEINLVDRIFVRSGAADAITSGLSTFMVEMVETAHILHHATKRSLIIMDEIGRGTSTYDGISIAWAVAEYLVTQKKPAPKILFATHYHELQALEQKFPDSIRNYQMAVADDGGSPVFLHTVIPGGASHSFGVAVAQLAGIPETVITRSMEILKDLEQGKRAVTTTHNPLAEELATLDISRMTPLEALNTLSKLKEKIH